MIAKIIYNEDRKYNIISVIEIEEMSYAADIKALWIFPTDATESIYFDVPQSLYPMLAEELYTTGKVDLTAYKIVETEE